MVPLCSIFSDSSNVFWREAIKDKILGEGWLPLSFIKFSGFRGEVFKREVKDNNNNEDDNDDGQQVVTKVHIAFQDR